MKPVCKIAMLAGATLIVTAASWADTLQTHRIPAVLAFEAVGGSRHLRQTGLSRDRDGA